METMTQAVVHSTDTMLELQHRCDRCSAHANVSASKGDAVLLFCRHHWVESKDALTTWAERVIIWRLDPREG